VKRRRSERPDAGRKTGLRPCFHSRDHLDCCAAHHAVALKINMRAAVYRLPNFPVKGLDMATPMRTGRVEDDIATINATWEWMGPTLEVRRQSDRSTSKRGHGVIRNFDLASVFTEGRKMEHFSSVADLAQVWEVVRHRRR
jgi:hypothetical protein